MSIDFNSDNFTTQYNKMEEPSTPREPLSSIVQKTVSAIRERTFKIFSQISLPSKKPISDDVYLNMDETPSMLERVSSFSSTLQEVFNPLQDFLDSSLSKEIPDETSDAIHDIAAKKMSRQIDELSHRLSDATTAPYRSRIENLVRSLYKDFSPKKIDELKNKLKETAKNHPFVAKEGIVLIDEKIEKQQNAQKSLIKGTEQFEIIEDVIKIYKEVRSCLEVESSPTK